MKPSTRRSSAAITFRKNCLALLVGIAITSSVSAQQPTATTTYAIPSGDLIQVVNEISRSSGLQIVYDIESLRGLKSIEISGNFTLQQALDKALNDTGLTWALVNPTTISIRKKAPAPKPPAVTSPTTNSAVNGTAASLASANENKSNVKDLDDVVVVGSRLGISPVESALPVKLITREEIERSNASSIVQVLSYLSEVSVNNMGDRVLGTNANVGGGSINSSTVQLRGLPRGTTLILINGRRAGESSAIAFSGQFDLSTIPLSLVDRIEVLTAGASAVYGGDGLAGVVNVVLKKDAEGFDARLGYKSADGYEEKLTSVMYGRSWSKGNITATLNWSDSSGLTSSDRAITADQDFRRFGGMDYRPGQNPGTVYSLVGCDPAPGYCNSSPGERGNLPGLDSPYAIVPTGQNGEGLTASDFISTAGQIGRSSLQQNIFAEEQKKSASISANYNLTNSIELFSEFSYSTRDIPAYEVPFVASSSYGGSAQVPADNPYNPFGVAVGVDYTYDDTGIYRDFSQSYSRAVFGVRGRSSRWDWEVSGWQADDQSRISGAGYFANDAIAEALSSTDPLTALNLFVGDGTAPASAEVLRSLVTPTSGDYRSTSRGINAYVKGPIFKLPAGEATGLLGAEKLEHKLKQDVEDLVNPSQFSGTTGSDAVFAETRVPLLVGKAEGERARMAVTGAIRREWSDKYQEPGDSSTLGLEFRPSRNLLLRGSYSTAFKPALTYNAVTDEYVYQSGAYDPVFDEYVTFPLTTGGGLPQELKPETSTSRTIGAMYDLGDNWNFSFTHWENTVKNRIAYVSTDFFLENEGSFSDRVIRDPNTGRIVSVDGRPVNINISHVAGVDIGVNGHLLTRFGGVHQSLNASYTYKHDEQVTPGAPLRDNLSVISSTGWSPRWKIVYRSTLEISEATNISVAAKYVSRYRDSFMIDREDGSQEYPELGDFWLVDLNIDVRLGQFSWLKSKAFRNAKASLGVNNIFDKSLEFCASCGYGGYDASQYDVLGRTVSAELRFGF